MPPLDRLNIFYQDEVTRETVKAFLNAKIDELAVKMAREDGHVIGIREAAQIINNAFNDLDERYGARQTKRTENGAR